MINRSESRLIALELRNQAARASQRNATSARVAQTHSDNAAAPPPATQLPAGSPSLAEDAANESADVRKAG